MICEICVRILNSQCLFRLKTGKHFIWNLSSGWQLGSHRNHRAYTKWKLSLSLPLSSLLATKFQPHSVQRLYWHIFNQNLVTFQKQPTQPWPSRELQLSTSVNNKDFTLCLKKCFETWYLSLLCHRILVFVWAKNYWWWISCFGSYWYLSPLILLIYGVCLIVRAHVGCNQKSSSSISQSEI